MNSCSMNMREFDIIIIGGGVVGLSFACCLAQLNLSVALIERGKPEWQIKADEYALRVSAITLASQRFLNKLGVWSTICAKRASPVEQMNVWDGTGIGVIHFAASDIGEESLAHIVENDVICQALYQEFSNSEYLHYFAESEIEILNIDDDAVHLTLVGGENLSSKLIVGADGAHSWLRQKLQFEVTKKNYKQTAVVAHAWTQLPHQQTAMQRFLPSGPLGFLPMQDEHIFSIVWSTSDEEAKGLLALKDAEFCAALAKEMDYKLGDVERISQRVSFPLHGQHVKQYVKPRVALIGDAAHTIHPLAGQGLNLGLLDAAALAECIQKALEKGNDFSDYSVLRRYERWRKGHNHSMQKSMEAFQGLFGNKTSSVRWLRNVGLNLADSMSPVKKLMMSYAMGIVGDLPKIMRADD